MFKEKVKRLKVSLPLAVTTLSLSGIAHASEGGTSDAVVSALTTTASDITGTLLKVAPIGLGIAGTFLVWRYGMKFFKSLSK